MGRVAGKSEVHDFMLKNADNFISYDNIEKWFGLEPSVVPSYDEIDEILDLRKTKSIKTMAIYISPYKRFFSYYLSYLDIKNLRAFNAAKDTLTTDSFETFASSHTEFPQMVTAQLTDLYGGKDIMDHIIEYDSLVPDLRKALGIQTVPDDLIDEYQEILSQYRDFYTDKVRAWVEETYYKDIDLFGYKF
jgi:hypothetical protein